MLVEMVKLMMRSGVSCDLYRLMAVLVLHLMLNIPTASETVAINRNLEAGTTAATLTRGVRRSGR